MKCLFLTNQASYHQMHFARAMVNLLGADNFRIAFEKGTSAARSEMGWKDDYNDDCILRLADEAQKAECLRWINEADVVIQGRFPIRYVRSRIKSGKLTFACQERLWKKPPSWKRKLSRSVHLYKNYYSVNVPNYHFLAIGSYAAKDLNGMGIFVGRSWRYGYFIDAVDEIEKPQNKAIKLLWCARFSEVKQPQKAVDILQGLVDAGVDAQLTMIGDGDLKNEMQNRIVEQGLSDQVIMTGWQTQQQVFDHMRQSDVFLMTSHHGEGWGLVVNEALSHGCAVIANQQLGSAQWLISHGENGLLYQDNHLQSVIGELAQLNVEQIIAMGRKAQSLMRDQWSAQVAAQRTLALSTALLEGDTNKAKQLFANGVCSFIG